MLSIIHKLRIKNIKSLRDNTSILKNWLLNRSISRTIEQKKEEEKTQGMIS